MQTIAQFFLFYTAENCPTKSSEVPVKFPLDHTIFLSAILNADV